MACKKKSGCKWTPGKKKKSGTCENDGSGDSGSSKGGSSSSSSSGGCSASNHQSFASQKKHCGQAKKFKGCKERGCKWASGNCSATAEIRCSDLASASCCRAPGCTLAKSGACSGNFKGWK
eukprot:TRINITY_DN1286_c0_g1_i1.p1 TRINITY_DN1286_c0_g1~~TRINITY_DN1286_c0_g1_i1.p1  ORF type:complete len:121 (+),score=24.98 TRINITY_DN1286_c0_g1_i1:327-689(+)